MSRELIEMLRYIGEVKDKVDSEKQYWNKQGITDFDYAMEAQEKILDDLERHGTHILCANITTEDRCTRIATEEE